GTPLVADMDGDGRAELVLWRAGSFVWVPATTNIVPPQTVQWGSAAEGDVPMLGDVDGDGRADPFVYRRPVGTWVLLTSSTGYSYAAAGVKQWGNQAAGDVPLLTDLDGDHLVDLTVWRASTGTWYWLPSTTGFNYAAGRSRQWGSGASGDIPIAR